jgi:hypothetical protein
MSADLDADLPDRNVASPNGSLASGLPGLVRVAVSSSWRIMQWAFTTTTTTVTDVAKAVVAGESPAKVVDMATAPIRTLVRDAFGPTSDNGDRAPVVHSRPGATAEELRARGAQLLSDSADVWFEDDTHPAYARILEELSPDEARILRFLAIEGPQPAVDVRTHRPLGVGSELVSGGLSMIGRHAGVRNLERTKADLNNLYRLGLLWFSREEVEDSQQYQVVEVQPDVIEAMRKAGRSPKTVHRSIHLTEFGEDFCAVCLGVGRSDDKA